MDSSLQEGPHLLKLKCHTDFIFSTPMGSPSAGTPPSLTIRSEFYQAHRHVESGDGFSSVEQIPSAIRCAEEKLGCRQCSIYHLHPMPCGGENGVVIGLGPVPPVCKNISVSPVLWSWKYQDRARTYSTKICQRGSSDATGTTESSGEMSLFSVTVQQLRCVVESWRNHVFGPDHSHSRLALTGWLIRINCTAHESNLHRAQRLYD